MHQVIIMESNLITGHNSDIFFHCKKSISQSLSELPRKLSPENYQAKFTALLYCEEVAMDIQIGQFSLKAVTLERLEALDQKISVIKFATDYKAIKNQKNTLL